MLGEIIEEDLRSITRQLYPSIIRVGLPCALNSLADRFRTVFEVEVDVSDEVAGVEESGSSRLTDELRLILYRIAEEALTNVAKHSAATSARISVGLSSDGEIVLTVHDDGRGFDASKAIPSYGFQNMKEYAEGLGGRLDVQTFPGWSTTVKVRVPLEDNVRAYAQA